MTEIAHMLQTYGPWGILVIAFAAITRLWHAYLQARDKNETTLQKQVESALKLVAEMTTASVEQRMALEQILAALETIERRLENVEKHR